MRSIVNKMLCNNISWCACTTTTQVTHATRKNVFFEPRGRFLHAWYNTVKSAILTPKNAVFDPFLTFLTVFTQTRKNCALMTQNKVLMYLHEWRALAQHKVHIYTSNPVKRLVQVITCCSRDPKKHSFLTLLMYLIAWYHTKVYFMSSKTYWSRWPHFCVFGVKKGVNYLRLKGFSIWSRSKLSDIWS